MTKVSNDIEAFLGTRLGGLLSVVILVAVVLLLTIWSARFVSRLLHRLVERQKESDPGKATVLSFLRYAAIAAVYFVGLSIIVSNIPFLSAGINKVLAAGGVIAVVAGFAAQEALGSVVSGMMILAFKPFVIGDVVRYIDNDISGVIEEITLHHTAIRTWENKHVIIPNSKMNSAIVENADYTDSHVCVFLEIGITYESDLELAKKLLFEAVAQDERHLDVRTAEQKAADEPEVTVLVLDLSESAVKLRASLWAQDNGTAFALKCAVLERVKKMFDENGVEIAYPHMVVVPK